MSTSVFVVVGFHYSESDIMSIHRSRETAEQAAKEYEVHRDSYRARADEWYENNKNKKSEDQDDEPEYTDEEIEFGYWDDFVIAEMELRD